MPTSDTPRVLVIDDDAFIRDLARAVLGQRGFQIDFAATGAEGLSRLAEPPPDLVVLDLGLPDLPGLEVLRLLRGARGWDRVRILMLTADHETDSLVRAKAAGASGYLCKPVEPATLDRMVSDLLSDASLIWLDDYTRSRRTS